MLAKTKYVDSERCLSFLMWHQAQKLSALCALNILGTQLLLNKCCPNEPSN